MIDEFDEAFLKGYDVLKIPVIENGKPVWGERFPIAKIEKLKKTVGMKKFSAQMMLTPVDIREGRFDVSKLSFYSSSLQVCERNRLLDFSICGKKIVYASCWWDPSYGSKDGDGSVVSVVFIDTEGKYYLHDVEYLYHSDMEEVDSAHEQCVKVAEFLKRNHIPLIYVESNGIGKFLPEFLKSELLKMGINTQVIAKTSKVSKSLRILDAFDGITSAEYLFVNEKVRETPFIAEFSDWNVDSKAHDDGLDSVAGAILSEPVKMPVCVHNSSFNIRKKPLATFRVRTDFKI